MTRPPIPPELSAARRAALEAISVRITKAPVAALRPALESADPFLVVVCMSSMVEQIVGSMIASWGEEPTQERIQEVWRQTAEGLSRQIIEAEER